MLGNMIASRTGCGLCNNLGQKKIEQQTPTPQKNQGWSRAEAKTRHFIISDPGEMGGGGSKFSMCFVQDCSRTDDVWLHCFRPSTRKQKAGDFKNLQLLTISNFKNTQIRVSGRGLRVICHPSDMLCISVQPIWRDVSACKESSVR